MAAASQHAGSQHAGDAGTALLDEVFDRAVRAFSENTPLDLGDLAPPHDELRPRIDAVVRLARRVTLVQPLAVPSVAGYDLIEELGAGGMGVVWLARQRTLGRLVALKVLPPAAAASSRSRARFAAEARALARVRHPALVQVFDVVAAEQACAYAMEPIEGRSLAQILAGMRARGGHDGAAFFAELGAEPPERAPLHVVVCRMFVQVLRALAALHRAGLVHRDIKPSNILVRSDGRPVLTDLGLVLDEDNVGLTRTGQFVGTPAYAAPEQLRGERAGPAADVWAAGVCLFETLTRVHPFAAGDANGVRARIAADAGTRLRAVDRGLPRDLETIVGKATANDPAQRYASADAFADDLERLLSLQPITAVPASWLVRAGKAMRRHRTPWMAAALGATLAAVLAALLVLHASHWAALPARAAEAVRRARLDLLQPNFSERTLIAVKPVAPHLDQFAALRHDQARIRRSLDAYDEAAKLWPLSPTAAAEREVARIVEGVLHGTPDSAPTPPALAPCPVTMAVAAGAPFPKAGDDRMTGITDLDRRSLGLLAFLLGEAEACHVAWAGLDLRVDQPDPLIDAAAGTLHLVEDRAARALPRLLAARAFFPEAGFLYVDAADAACRVGDLVLCEQLLDAAESLALKDRFETHLQVRADLLAAQGKIDAAIAVVADLRTRRLAITARDHLAAALAEAGRWREALLLRAVLRLEAAWLDPEGRNLIATLDAWWQTSTYGELVDCLSAYGPEPSDATIIVQAMHGSRHALRAARAKSTTPAPRSSALRPCRPDWRDLELTPEILKMQSLSLLRAAWPRRLFVAAGLFLDSPLGAACTAAFPPAVRLAHRARALLGSAIARCIRVHARPGWLALLGGLALAPAASAQPPAMPAPPGLVSWWPGDGDARDVVGPNHAQVMNGTSFAPGKVGQAFTFDGVDDHVVTQAHAVGISLASAFTFAWWFRTSAPQQQNVLTLISGPAIGPQPGINVQIPFPGHPAETRLLCDLYAPWPTNWVRVTSAPGMNDGDWHFAVFQRDSLGTVRLLVDGTVHSTATLIGDATPAADTDLILGGGLPPDIGPRWAGQLDEIDFYARALSDAEIQAIYAAGAAGKCRPDVVDAAQSLVDPSTSTVSAFAGRSTITVTPRNACATPLGAGLTVALATTAGTLLGTVTDNNDGTYAQVLEAAPGAASATVSATVNAIAITDTATVTFVSVDPTQSTITVSPDATFRGGHAIVTVTPKDDLGVAVGAGFTVQLQTTLGTLAGTVTDNNDGTYSQRLDATQVGTAAITATVNGLPLPPASFTILDGSIGAVIGLRRDNNALPYDTIQQAVNRAPADQLVRILVNPGTYDEVVHLRNRSNLQIEGLSSVGLVTVRGFRLSDSEDITIAYFDIDGSQRARHGIKLLGGGNHNQRVVVHDCFIHDVQGTHDGIRLGRDNCQVALRHLHIERSGGDGISMADGPCEATIADVTILASGLDGIRTADEATVRIERCRIEDSGTRGHEREGYGIFRQRHRTGFPALITLFLNTFAGNRGRVVAGKSTANLGNYDQILDATDSQGGY